MEIKIEKAKESDLTSLLELENRVFGKETEASFRHALTVPSYYYAVAKFNNKIVGFIALNLLFEAGEILTLAVDCNFRRLGIGKKLIEFAFDVFKKNDIFNVFLEVDEINEIAQKVYLKMGFEKISIRKGYYNHKDKPTDAIIMQKNLND